jgi:Ion channel
MRVISAVAGVLLVGTVLWETFETLVLPRRITRRLRFSRWLYREMWTGWSSIGRRHPGTKRENYLSVFAPLCLFVLLGVWALGVVLGFALILWGFGVPLSPSGEGSFASHLYMSATTFVTLGLGDVTPGSSFGRAVIAIEAGTGFAYLALVISYLPVLYQSFSRREVSISMLDEWAGSPPIAVELLRRSSAAHGLDSVEGLLRDWERWAAELLESHLSYPFLAYYRSQHEHQSWLAALTAILDTSALVLSGVEGVPAWQARRTFAISRHAVVDLAQAFHQPPESVPGDRARRVDAEQMRRTLEAGGVRLNPHAVEHFEAFRRMYEPFVHPLSTWFEMPLPPLLAGGQERVDDWQRTAWELPG